METVATLLPFVAYVVVFFILGAIIIWLTHRAVTAEETRQRSAEQRPPHDWEERQMAARRDS